jgi:hypothetical protein
VEGRGSWKDCETYDTPRRRDIPGIEPHIGPPWHAATTRNRVETLSKSL